MIRTRPALSVTAAWREFRSDEKRAADGVNDGQGMDSRLTSQL